MGLKNNRSFEFFSTVYIVRKLYESPGGKKGCRFTAGAQSSALNSCLGPAPVLRVTYIDFHTSGACVGRFQSSELGLLLELGSQNYYIIRVGWLQGWESTLVDSQTSDAPACRIQRSELGLILELGCQPIRFVRVILRGAIDLRT